jgi:diacylglycerol kinase (ATP)
VIHVVYNAQARGGRVRRLRGEIRQALDTELGAEGYRWVETSSEANGVEVAAAAAAGDIVVAVGGDGSVHTVIEGLWRSDFRATLGIIPAGTGNDFAFGLGMPTSVRNAVRVLGTGSRRMVDVGEASLDGQAPLPFVNAIGIGFDAAASEHSRRRKFLPGVLRYLVSSLETLLTWKSPQGQVTGQALAWQGPLMFVTFGNGPRSGGGFMITPGADPSDGLLEACVVSALSVTSAVRVIPSVMRGEHGTLPQVELHKGTSFSVALDRDVPVHADGEIVSTASRTMDVTVRAGVMNVLVPSA